MNRVAVFMCLYLVTSCNSQNELFEGAACESNGRMGTCTIIRTCTSALQALRREIRPHICSFSGNEPVVCCLDNEVSTETETTTKIQWMTTAPPTTTTALPDASTTRDATTIPGLVGSDSKYLGKEDNEINLNSKVAAEPKDCPPISLNQTAPKTGQKAWDKCIEYQEKLVLPCDASQGKRFNYCGNDLNVWILNGEEAYEGEFPHMALVGFGTDPADLAFLCGGTLISENFVMTAGHCMSSRSDGPISHVLLGMLKRSSFNVSNLHKVLTVHKHPNYTPPRKYNDIALLQLETPVTLTELTIPACLDVGAALDDKVAIATGWGNTQFKGTSSDILQKVDLTKFTDNECAARFPATRNMRIGFDNTSQLCYGDRTMAKDTCQGDSGGPLQLRHKKIYCMYVVIGITSFGRACGIIGEPALYTRVAHYLPWIEATVWP